MAGFSAICRTKCRTLCKSCIALFAKVLDPPASTRLSPQNNTKLNISLDKLFLVSHQFTHYDTLEIPSSYIIESVSEVWYLWRLHTFSERLVSQRLSVLFSSKGYLLPTHSYGIRKKIRITKGASALQTNFLETPVKDRVDPP